MSPHRSTDYVLHDAEQDLSPHESAVALGAARERGWFTLDLGTDAVGVLAESVSSKDAPSGAAEISLHVGVRVEQVESAVENILGLEGTYRDRTTVTGIVYVSPEERWMSWTLDSESSGNVAHELAHRCAAYASRYLHKLVADRAALVEAVRSSASFSQSRGKCRVAVLTAQFCGPKEGLAFLDQLEVELGDRTGCCCGRRTHDDATCSRMDPWIGLAPCDRRAR